MITTSKQMTLEKAIEKIEQYSHHSSTGQPFKDAWQVIKAELAHQRNDEPVAMTRTRPNGDVVYVPYKKANYSPEWTLLYTHPHPRNAAKVTNEDTDIAEQAYLKASAIGTPCDWIGMRAALSAVASRDREDAERFRWLMHTPKTKYELLAFVLQKDPIKSIDAARRENKP